MIYPQQCLRTWHWSAVLTAHAPSTATRSYIPCSIPVTFAAGVRSTHASEEVYGAEICLEYVSPESAGPLLSADSPVATPRGTNQAVLGRHAVLPVEVHVQPSLQVAAVQFREIYLPAGAGAAAAANGAGGEAAGQAAGTAGAVDDAAAEAPDAAGEGSSGSSATFERRCVMEVAVANRGRWPLQVGSSALGLGGLAPSCTHACTTGDAWDTPWRTSC